MKLDLLIEIQVPKPWEPDQRGAEYRAFWNVMEQIQLADRLGFDTVWFVEHHFREEWSHCSAPEVVMSAVSQRAQNIRLGHAVVLLPYPINHPVRIAERAAAMDIISNGRLEFGVGRSLPQEWEAFRIDPEETRAMCAEALEIIPKMWTQDTFSHKGRYFDIPERNVLPKPYQKPHPPIWMAATSEESFPLAGSLGIGALGLTILLDNEAVEGRVKAYKHAVKSATPVGSFVNNQMGVFTLVHCADTRQKARDNGAYEAIAWWLALVVTIRKKWEGIESLQGQFADFPILQRYAAGEVGVEAFDRENMVIIGDPQDVIRKIEVYERMGVDRVLCDVEFGHMDQKAVLRSIELLGKEVIPHFKKKGSAHRIEAERG